ncbi:hypothetical protein [Halovenus marina]|jgi:hypothetical protein
MYEFNCDVCGRVGFHPSRVAAQTMAKAHIEETGHTVEVVEFEGVS